MHHAWVEKVQTSIHHHLGHQQMEKSVLHDHVHAQSHDHYASLLASHHNPIMALCVHTSLVRLVMVIVMILVMKVMN